MCAIARVTADTAVIVFADGDVSAAVEAFEQLKDTPEGFMYDMTPGWELEETAQAGWVTISRVGAYVYRWFICVVFMLLTAWVVVLVNYVAGSYRGRFL